MSVRDTVLPPIDAARAVVASLGLRRYAVTLRRRVWSGSRNGEGTCTVEDIVLTPSPRVRFKSPFALQMSGILQSGGKIEDRYYQIDKITPAFVVAGGYTPTQLRLTVPQDDKNVDAVVILVGDDGMLRECTQILFEDDRSFGYSMVVQERDNPAVSLVSVLVTSPGPVAHGTTVQLAARATYADGQAYDVTQLVKWSAPPSSVGIVSTFGRLTALAAGSVDVSAAIGQLQAPPVTIVVT